METIRLATPRDGAACASIYTPYVRESAISFESSPPSADEFRDRISKTLESLPWLVYERDDRVVGYAYAGNHRGRDAYQWSVETSVYVDDQHHRSGVATALYESLLATLRLQGFYNVYAGMTAPNPPSAGFHESMGFEPVGTYRNVGYKDGEWHDVEWFSLAIRDHTEEPTAPTSIDDMHDAPALEDAISSGLSAGE